MRRAPARKGAVIVIGAGDDGGRAFPEGVSLAGSEKKRQDGENVLDLAQNRIY
jgi:hypothetical protein